jgi:probable rRNA maturation factor
LGDIFLCVERAIEQSKELTTYKMLYKNDFNYYNDKFIVEISLLLIHSILHLLNYDHIKQIDKNKMFIEQKRILHNFFRHFRKVLI